MIAVCARMCYSAKPVSQLLEDLTQEETDRMVKHILAVRHVSVLRHVIFCFTVEGVSRSFSHQFVRYHVGLDVEQRSQHFRKEKQFSYNLPESVRGAEPDQEVCEVTAEELYVNHMGDCQTVYDTLISMGVDKSEARQALPNACETQMVVTMNLNAAMNVVSQRACRLNTPEILQVAVQIRRLIGQVMPEALDFLGPTCWSQGTCFEGKAKYLKSCRRPWQSPTVLWDREFPRKTTYVGIEGGRHFEKAVEFTGPDAQGVITNVAFPAKEEPAASFQEAQGEDAKNQS
jgi:thymidylate synthase (FAD)